MDSLELRQRATGEMRPRLDAVVATLRTKYPHARRIELLGMVRASGNLSCGSDQGVDHPMIDAAIDTAARRHAGVVVAGPRFEAKTCGRSRTERTSLHETGRATVAKLVADHYARDTDFVPGAPR